MAELDEDPPTRLYDAMNQNAVKIEQAVAENPRSVSLLAREHARCVKWLEAHARAERELRL